MIFVFFCFFLIAFLKIEANHQVLIPNNTRPLKSLPNSAKFVSLRLKVKKTHTQIWPYLIVTASIGYRAAQVQSSN